MASPQNQLNSSSTLSHRAHELQISGLTSLFAHKQGMTSSRCNDGRSGGRGGGRSCSRLGNQMELEDSHHSDEAANLNLANPQSYHSTKTYKTCSS